MQRYMQSPSAGKGSSAFAARHNPRLARTLSAFTLAERLHRIRLRLLRTEEALDLSFTAHASNRLDRARVTFEAAVTAGGWAS